MAAGRVLGVVAVERSPGEAFFYVIGDVEGGSVAEMAVKLSEEDFDALQVEIAEMEIGIGDDLEPLTQVGRSGITRDKEDPSPREIPIEQITLSTNHAKIFHILYSDHQDILGDDERVPIIDEEETALHGGDQELFSCK